MKSTGKMLVTVAMMLSAAAMVGCNRSGDQADEPVAPVESPASAPVVEEAEQAKAEQSKTTATPGFEQNSLRFGFDVRFPSGPRYYAPHAPPAVRVEHRGVAPSRRHFWAPGYWRWSGRQYSWIGGRWEYERPHHTYVGPRWVAAGPRWQYVPGHWVRRG